MPAEWTAVDDADAYAGSFYWDRGYVVDQEWTLIPGADGD
jgi:hypothetical protein